MPQRRNIPQYYQPSGSFCAESTPKAERTEQAAWPRVAQAAGGKPPAARLALPRTPTPPSAACNLKRRASNIPINGITIFLAPFASINECRRGCQATARKCPTRCKRRRQAAAQKSSTHRRLGSAPRVLARVSSRREAAGGCFPEILSTRGFLCSQCIEREQKSCLL